MNKDENENKPPGGTQDERLLETPSADEFLHTDTWRVFRIMGEFVQGFEDLALFLARPARPWITPNMKPRRKPARCWRAQDSL
jgi:hypothetical protein